MTADPRKKGWELSAEELELWRAVTATVRQREPRKAKILPVSDHRPPPAVEHRAMADHTPKSRNGTRPLGAIDRRQHRDLTRGRLQIDARIDLYGRRLADAHQAVHDFLRRAHGEGARVVLIVTGKGGRSGALSGHGDGEVGVLRRQAPLWLADPRLRHVVAAFGEAAQAHGGAGALYVRLRRH